MWVWVMFSILKARELCVVAQLGPWCDNQGGGRGWKYSDCITGQELIEPMDLWTSKVQWLSDGVKMKESGASSDDDHLFIYVSIRTNNLLGDIAHRMTTGPNWLL